jgi:endonuclease/exonuclease/phosphatase (EEP) superfamily protein YafD
MAMQAAFRYMQFDSERYPSVDMTFIPTATLGILAREFEQQQMIGLLQTLGPNTPVLPLILKGILQNSSLSNRGELMQALEQMSQPNPQAAEAQQMQQQAAMELAQAQVADLQSKAQKQSAEAQKTMMEAQMIPEEQRVKLVQAAATNLDNGGDFEKRLKLADIMLKEKSVDLKAADIASNERIANLQMMNKSRK